jgi:rhodanese-related sulfurtransferase
MKNFHRVAYFLLLNALPSWGCGSAAKSENNAPDARSAEDTADKVAPSPDTSIPLPDAGPRDTLSTLVDARVADTTVPGIDALSPDTILIDARAADVSGIDAMSRDTVLVDARAADTKVSGIDALLPDTLAPRQDAQAPDAAAACAAAAFSHLSPLELKTLLDSGEDPFLINVKGTSISQIAGTDATLVGDIPGIETLVNHDLCANIVLYCLSGGTSQSIGSQLIAKGYKRVRDLAGGITAWKAAGYPTL